MEAGDAQHPPLSSGPCDQARRADVSHHGSHLRTLRYEIWFSTTTPGRLCLSGTISQQHPRCLLGAPADTAKAANRIGRLKQIDQESSRAAHRGTKSIGPKVL